jgi:beta-lactamase class A
LKNIFFKKIFNGEKRRLFGVVAVFAVLLIIGFCGGFLFAKNLGKQPAGNTELQADSSTEIREISEGGYRFTNPLLDCGDLNAANDLEITRLKNEVLSIINSQVSEKKINSAAVYFRDLNNGPWFGLNEKEKFFAASLLKVPLAIAYFKAAESDPGILEKEIVYEGGGYDAVQYFPPEKKLETGKRYAVQDLLENMIIYSDNAALSILNQMITEKKFEETYLRLGIEKPLDSEYAISVKTYASFFRVLFNSTYLNREYSEKALELLSRTFFDKGLRAGIPSEIIISHKFGEKSRQGEEEKQLHDCGIIYYPQKPYLLCVMVRGNDFLRNSDFIKNISATVFNKIKE